MSNHNSILEWMATVKQSAQLRVEPISLAQSTAWSLRDGVIRHVSHRFFTVMGAEWHTTNGLLKGQPFLEQPEIGTLGFLVRGQGEHQEVLVQAKVEPGNVGVVQLAPTCQATSSNAQQVHGGNKPPFVEAFAEPQAVKLYDVLQSEQGTRFYGKRNRNVCLLSQELVDFSPATHRWVSTLELFDLLQQDFLVNTDARSVLICSPWELLVGRQPFSRYQDGFGAELAVSFLNDSLRKPLEVVKNEIQATRNQAVRPQRIDLGELPGWRLTSEGVNSSQEIFQVRQVQVTVNGREVPSWDQPIIDSGQPGKIVLECARIDGVVHFLFQAVAEPGLYHQVELTPTVVIEPGMIATADSGGVVRSECWQSEEGGRFYQDKNLFRIVDTGKALAQTTGDESGEKFYWLTLKDIRSLLNEEGWFTNEARSVLSLLLAWM